MGASGKLLGAAVNACVTCHRLAPPVTRAKLFRSGKQRYDIVTLTGNGYLEETYKVHRIPVTAAEVFEFANLEGRKIRRRISRRASLKAPAHGILEIGSP